jgi:integrase
MLPSPADVQSAHLALTAESLEGMIAAIVTTAAERICAAQDQPGGLVVSKAWVKQDSKQVKKHGAEKASWYVEYLDPDGVRRMKSCGPGPEGHRLAHRLRRKIEAELITGTYQAKAEGTWAEFRAEFDATEVPARKPKTQVELRNALRHFERIVKPRKPSSLKSADFDRYRAQRRKERRFANGPLTSPFTINKELKMIRVALGVAQRWNYLSTVPKIVKERTPEKLPEYVLPEHFGALYGVCAQARLPRVQATWTPADWWRGLLTMAYMTGWRIGELLAFKRDDLDLERGTAKTGHADNKGGRDALIWLHESVVEHLAKLPGFAETVFPWPHNRKTLDKELHRLCRLAGVPEYGFHDFRRAFATMNHDLMTPEVLQRQMRHKDYETTQGYINIARQLKPAATKVYVPDVLRRATGTDG